jgi:hypothetical protein
MIECASGVEEKPRNRILSTAYIYDTRSLGLTPWSNHHVERSYLRIQCIDYHLTRQVSFFSTPKPIQVPFDEP